MTRDIRLSATLSHLGGRMGLGERIAWFSEESRRWRKSRHFSDAEAAAIRARAEELAATQSERKAAKDRTHRALVAAAKARPLEQRVAEFARQLMADGYPEDRALRRAQLAYDGGRCGDYEPRLSREAQRAMATEMATSRGEAGYSVNFVGGRV